MKKVFSIVTLFVLLCAGVYAAGNKNDLAYLGYDELQSVDGLTTADSMIVVESNIPKKGSTVADILALASPSDIESASGDLTVTRDAIVTRNLSAVDGTFTDDVSADDLTLTGDIVGDGGGEIRGMNTDYEIVTGDKTVTVAESGKTFLVTAAATITLPAVLDGLTYTIVNAAGIKTINVELDNADAFVYGGASAGASIRSAASSGDSVTVIGSKSDHRWYIGNMKGTWYL